MKRWKKCSAYISLGTVIEDSLLLKRFIESGIHLLPVFQLYLCSHVLLPSSPEQNCCLPSWMTNKKKMWLLVLIVPLKLHFHIPVCTASLISLEKFCDGKKQGSWWVWATPETEGWTYRLHSTSQCLQYKWERWQELLQVMGFTS